MDYQKVIRGLFMALFWLILQVVLMLFGLTVLVLFFFYMLDSIPRQLALFAHGLKAYIVQIFDFLLFVSDDKPFPVGELPSVDGGAVNANAANAMNGKGRGKNSSLEQTVPNSNK